MTVLMGSAAPTTLMIEKATLGPALPQEEAHRRPDNDALVAGLRERTLELTLANAALVRSVEEKDLLLIEIDHRAKNSLAIASSLLNIHAREHADPEVQALFQCARDHILGMAEVHDLLSKSPIRGLISLDAYLNRLCGRLRPIVEREHRIALVSSVQAGIVLDSDRAVVLGIVVTELVTNSIKHAFPSGGGGKISVNAFCSRPGWLELEVSDDGKGKINAREGSLGYGLIKAMVRKIGGELRLDDGVGVTATISFQAAESTHAFSPAPSEAAPAGL